MRKINVANASNKSWTRHRYILWFGACGATYVLVYANSLDDALEEAADWLADNAPGHLTTHSSGELKDLYTESLNDWRQEHEGEPSEEDEWRIQEDATADLTYTEAGWLTSYEWGISGEDLTPAEIRTLARGE